MLAVDKTNMKLLRPYVSWGQKYHVILLRSNYMSCGQNYHETLLRSYVSCGQNYHETIKAICELGTKVPCYSIKVRLYELRTKLP